MYIFISVFSSHAPKLLCTEHPSRGHAQVRPSESGKRIGFQDKVVEGRPQAGGRRRRASQLRIFNPLPSTMMVVIVGGGGTNSQNTMERRQSGNQTSGKHKGRGRARGNELREARTSETLDRRYED